jgi:hypothetical protein
MKYIKQNAIKKIQNKINIIKKEMKAKSNMKKKMMMDEIEKK